MADPALAALAEMLKRKQRDIVHPPVEVAATPPQLPPFQIPGANMLPRGGTPPQMPSPNSTEAPPPPLPQFQIPGMNALPTGARLPHPFDGLPPFTGLRNEPGTPPQMPPARAPQPAPAMQPQPSQPIAMGFDPTPPASMEMQGQTASAMQGPQLSMLARLLQGSPGVDDWRTKMDAMQWARQGQ